MAAPSRVIPSAHTLDPSQAAGLSRFAEAGTRTVEIAALRAMAASSYR